MPEVNLHWNPRVFKILGIVFSTNIDDIVNLNYNKKLDDIQRLLTHWSKRQLTPLGKITVIKSLALPKITHLFTNLPDPPFIFIEDLNSLFFKFLWNGKPNKMSKAYVCNHYENGGIRMVDVKAFLSSMKISWLKRIFSKNSLVSKMLLCTCPEMLNVYKCGGEYANVIMTKCTNQFWTDVVKHYKKMYTKCCPENTKEFLAERIHYNINIIRDNKTIHVKDWIENNIITVGNLVNTDGNFLTFNDFQAKFSGLSTNFVLYNGIIKSIKCFKEKLNIEKIHNNRSHEDDKVWNLIKHSPSNKIYFVLNSKYTKPTCIRKWEETFTETELDWKQIFIKPFKTTIDCQLRWFQVRIIHRIIPTQKYLFLCKLSDTPLCIFCNAEEETLKHLLWECPFVHKFWVDIKNWMETCQNNIIFSDILVILGVKQHERTDPIHDLIILLGKFYIYKCKLQNTTPSIVAFQNVVKHRYKVEKHSHFLKGTLCEFEQLWHPYLTLVQDSDNNQM